MNLLLFTTILPQLWRLWNFHSKRKEIYSDWSHSRLVELKRNISLKRVIIDHKHCSFCLCFFYNKHGNNGFHATTSLFEKKDTMMRKIQYQSVLYKEQIIIFKNSPSHGRVPSTKNFFLLNDTFVTQKSSYYRETLYKIVIFVIS